MALFMNSFDGVMNCRELMTPGAGIVPTRVIDLSLESSFHKRMLPSYEPIEYSKDERRIRKRKVGECHIPEAITSPYFKHAIDVIHRGVSMRPSVSEWVW